MTCRLPALLQNMMVPSSAILVTTWLDVVCPALKLRFELFMPEPELTIRWPSWSGSVAVTLRTTLVASFGTPLTPRTWSLVSGTGQGVLHSELTLPAGTPVPVRESMMRFGCSGA